jgi:hypothetical protein
MSGLPLLVQMTSPVWIAKPSISKVWIMFIVFIIREIEGSVAGEV